MEKTKGMTHPSEFPPAAQEPRDPPHSSRDGVAQPRPDKVRQAAMNAKAEQKEKLEVIADQFGQKVGAPDHDDYLNGLAEASLTAKVETEEDEAETQALSLRLQRGKRCAKIVKEMKRFRYLRLDGGRTVTEIQTECSDFLIWKLRGTLGEDDRHLFDNPNRWEAPLVTYTYGLLGKEYRRSWATIRDWVKDWNRSQAHSTNRQ